MLTCHSKDLSLTGKTTGTEALAMWNTAYTAWQNSNGSISIQQFIERMKTQYRNQKIRQRIVMRIIGVGGSYIIYDSFIDDSNQ